ncbi:hypothetical protein V144x_43280 [Gimesia aquarii]|uniref:Uncharacterized protein n=1 Tax=Gimesia aquarii TaxID=2527964 RepID=A0A517W0P9_9PLAN|nr:hypothetical protein V144x_43280 [Gimesia aquarii]
MFYDFKMSKCSESESAQRIHLELSNHQYRNIPNISTKKAPLLPILTNLPRCLHFTQTTHTYTKYSSRTVFSSRLLPKDHLLTNDSEPLRAFYPSKIVRISENFYSMQTIFLYIWSVLNTQYCETGAVFLVELRELVSEMA